MSFTLILTDKVPQLLSDMLTNAPRISKKGRMPFKNFNILFLIISDACISLIDDTNKSFLFNLINLKINLRKKKSSF